MLSGGIPIHYTLTWIELDSHHSSLLENIPEFLFIGLLYKSSVSPMVKAKWEDGVKMQG
jgi:hypothetical protein